MATPKQEEIKVRVTESMKARVAKLADARGESESVIVREALTAYLLRDDAAAVVGRPLAPEPHPSYTNPAKSSSKRKSNAA